ncbi:hypothetical protein C4J81_06375 [Deltaproteobacteria bacterium Smac51]|nr:hypothetical protein C4J81_06375 [Deltaproteobacteria bacterium Smac51]
MAVVWEIALLVIIIVWGFIFIIGPFTRRGDETIKYENLVELIAEGKVTLEIKNYRIANEVASSSIYPFDKFKKYRVKACLFRGILLAYIAALWHLSSIGALEIIIALIIRGVSLRSLSYEVTRVGLSNQKVYDAVSTLDGWEYKKK